MTLSTPHLCTVCGRGFPPGEAACPVHGVPSAPLEAVPEVPPTGDETALVGQQLGEYRVKRCIGQGGMGVVYEAEHVTLGRKVAIKLLREEHARSPYARNLLSEARAASAIQHRGIIDVFGFGQQPGIGQYLVMEYLEGQPLSEFMAEHAPLPPAEAIQLLGEVLDALSAAHAQGVIHRDLKPSNIFIVREQDGSRYIKLLDFGLAKRTTPDGLASRSEIIVGTPNYMAPEQALNEAVGPRTDLYAVGVIAFEMLTRRRLFAGRSSLEMVAHHLRSPPPRPSFYVELPARLDGLILRLLAKEPQARPATASEVATELRALLPTDESTGKPAVLSPLFQAKYSPAFAFMEEPTQQQTPREPASSRQPSPFTPHTLPSPAVPLTPPEVRRVRWQRGAATSALLVLLAGGGGLMSGMPWEPERSQEPAMASVQHPMASPSPASPPSAAQPEAPAPRSEPPPEPASLASSGEAPAAKRAPPPARPSPSKTPAPARSARPAPSAPAVATAARPPPSPSESAPAEEHPAATGTLHITVKGAWADVWVDGKMLGRVPPLHRYTLPAGEHELELRNPGLPTHTDRIVILPGGTLPYASQLQPLAPPPPASP